jgi:hypothetical protein
VLPFVPPYTNSVGIGWNNNTLAKLTNEYFICNTFMLAIRITLLQKPAQQSNKVATVVVLLFGIESCFFKLKSAVVLASLFPYNTVLLFTSASGCFLN